MLKLPLAAVLLAATPLFAQQTGVSHPLESDTEAAATPAPAQVPVVSAPVLVVPSSTPASDSRGTAAYDPTVIDASPAVPLKHRDVAKSDPDARIVGDDSIPSPNEVAAGTMVRIRLKTPIETATTQPGTPFRAETTEAVLHEGRVIVPAGAVVEGKVTEVRGGKRFRGPALIHLQAQTIVLPDGSRMPVHASVIDTDQFGDTRIDDEGNIVRKDHAKQALATLGLATGSGAAAGGVVAGVPGALIGAGIGAGVSTIMWLKADRQTQLPADTLVVLALTSPLVIQPLVREPEYSQQIAEPMATPVGEVPTVTEPQAFVPMN